MTPSSLSDGQTELRLAGSAAASECQCWPRRDYAHEDYCPLSNTAVPASPSLLTPREHGAAGAQDAVERMPGFVTKALGDALIAHHGQTFIADDIRLMAERSDAVRGWLAHVNHRGAYGGWWQRAVRRHGLRRTVDAPRVSRRPEARGRTQPCWSFPQSAVSHAVPTTEAGE